MVGARAEAETPSTPSTRNPAPSSTTSGIFQLSPPVRARLIAVLPESQVASIATADQLRAAYADMVLAEQRQRDAMAMASLEAELFGQTPPADTPPTPVSAESPSQDPIVDDPTVSEEPVPKPVAAAKASSEALSQQATCLDSLDWDLMQYATGAPEQETSGVDSPQPQRLHQVEDVSQPDASESADSEAGNESPELQVPVADNDQLYIASASNKNCAAVFTLSPPDGTAPVVSPSRYSDAQDSIVLTRKALKSAAHSSLMVSGYQDNRKSRVALNAAREVLMPLLHSASQLGANSYGGGHRCVIIVTPPPKGAEPSWFMPGGGLTSAVKEAHPRGVSFGYSAVCPVDRDGRRDADSDPTVLQHRHLPGAEPVASKSFSTNAYVLGSASDGEYAPSTSPLKSAIELVQTCLRNDGPEQEEAVRSFATAVLQGISVRRASKRRMLAHAAAGAGPKPTRKLRLSTTLSRK